MIDKAIQFLVSHIDDYVELKTGQAGPHIKLVHLADGDLDGPQIEGGKLGAALVNVEEERVAKAQRPVRAFNGSATGYLQPEVRLNLYLLIAANPSGEGSGGEALYGQALRLLSYVVQFFQGRNEFTPTNSPGMDPELELLQLEMISIPLEEQSYLWGAVSAAYMPSVVYKIRMISIQDDQMEQVLPAVTEIDPKFQ